MIKENFKFSEADYQLLKIGRNIMETFVCALKSKFCEKQVFYKKNYEKQVIYKKLTIMCLNFLKFSTRKL